MQRRFTGPLVAALVVAAPAAHAEPLPGSGAPPAGGGWAGGAAAAPPSYEPTERPLRSDEPPPPGYHVEERPRAGLYVSGLIVGGLPYGIGVMTVLGGGTENAKGWLLFPVVGPWMTLGRRSSSCGDGGTELSDRDAVGCAGDVLSGTLLVMDGVLQFTGAALIAAGVGFPRRWAVRDGLGGEFTLQPRVFAGGGALELRSAF